MGVQPCCEKRVNPHECQCLGKERFDNRTLAEKAARRIRKFQKQSVNSYQCDFCAGWHIGSRRKVRSR